MVLHAPPAVRQTSENSAVEADADWVMQIVPGQSASLLQGLPQSIVPPPPHMVCALPARR
jgi:hypothetical protein